MIVRTKNSGAIDLVNSQLHLVANASPRSGGEGLAALRYAQSIAKAGCKVMLLSRERWISNNSSFSDENFILGTLPRCKNYIRELYVQYKFMRLICEQRKINLIHLHGMWSPFLAVAALLAYNRGIPLVISPHGCLEPVALGYKKTKKWLALKIYQGAVLRSADIFITTAKQELNSLRDLGYRQPIAVIPLGVEIPSLPTRSIQAEIKTFLFLSRIHPKKGLLDLVEAWAIVRQPGWKIVIAGGDEAGHLAKVEALIRAKGLESDFEFLGFVEGESKQACFDKADVFILPTYSENFGIAIVEALASELPVITTTGAPWSDLVEHHCGWWVEPGVQGISSAMTAAMACEPAKLKEMGRRGRQLVVKNYSWKIIGEEALNVTSWLLDRTRPKPDEVQISAD